MCHLGRSNVLVTGICGQAENGRSYNQSDARVLWIETYSDNSGEIKAAMKFLQLPHNTCCPHVPQTNGIIESAVKKVKEGTSCTLSQSGFVDAHWVEAMNCFCFLKNVVDILQNDKTAYSMRFGE